jgi:hypothetical protein
LRMGVKGCPGIRGGWGVGTRTVLASGCVIAEGWAVRGCQLACWKEATAERMEASSERLRRGSG